MTPVELARKGWHLIPWSNRSASILQPLVKGYLGTLPTPEQVEAWAKQWPKADWAIKPTFHVVLDIEMKNGLDGEQELIEKYQPLEGYPSTKTFNGGRHVWMRVPHDCTLKGGVWIGEALEVKFNASVHIPPSEGYAWLEPLGVLADVPLAPDWFMDAWAKAAPPVAAKLTPDEMFPEGQRHSLLCSAAGSLRNLGLGEEGIFLGLQGVRADKCENPETVSDDELRSIAKSYAAKEANEGFEMRLARGEERAVAVAAFTGVPPAEPPKHARASEVSEPKLAVAALRPTPLLADWVDWVIRCAPRPQPALSLLAACVGIGGLVGRDLVWHGSHANVFGLGLASSGSGKDAPLHSIRKVYDAIGRSDLLGAGDWDSDAGMLTEISVQQSIVWPVDELGMYLEQLGKPNCPGYITKTGKNLTIWYSCEPIKGKALKGKEATSVNNPYPSALTFVQPKIFARVYDEKLSEQGLINRFVPFLGEHLPPMNFAFKKEAPPESLVDALKEAPSTVLDPADIADRGPLARPVKEIDCPAEVLEYFHECGREMERKVQSIKWTDERRATLMGRCFETSKKFSLIHAWSLNPSAPVMTRESVRWGFEIATYSTEVLLHIAASRANTPHAGNVDRIYLAIKTAGAKGITPGVLINQTLRDMEPNKRDSIINDLINAGSVHRVKPIPGRPGPKAFRYVADIFYTPEEQP